MIVKITKEDAREVELEISEDLDARIQEILTHRIMRKAKELTHHTFDKAVQKELTEAYAQGILPAMRKALADPEIEAMLDKYATALVEEVVKKKVRAKTEAWLKAAQEIV